MRLRVCFDRFLDPDETFLEFFFSVRRACEGGGIRGGASGGASALCPGGRWGFGEFGAWIGGGEFDDRVDHLRGAEVGVGGVKIRTFDVELFLLREFLAGDRDG